MTTLFPELFQQEEDQRADDGRDLNVNNRSLFRRIAQGVAATQMILGEARDYPELLAILRERKDALGTSMERLDEIAGLPARYVSKLFAPIEIKSLGKVSLGPLLGALGLKLVVVLDDDAWERVKNRHQRSPYTGRKIPADRRGELWRKNPDLARKSRLVQVLRTPAYVRSEMARAAIAVRWGEVKRTVRAAGTSAAAARSARAPVRPRRSAGTAGRSRPKRPRSPGRRG